ncbi:MAG: rhodanese-like domain-containing protein [Cyanobacteria bacterium J06638_22]
MTRLTQLLTFSVLGLGGCLLVVTAHRSLSTREPSAPQIEEASLAVDSQESLAAIAEPLNLADRWIVSPEEARDLITSGATVLDARNRRSQLLGILEGSVAVSWRQFSRDADPNRGKLLADLAVLQERLQEVGISGDRPVVVVANPTQGWGEDGRIAWMLRTMGHTQAVIVDGGYQAVVNLGLPTTLSIARAAEQPGDFVPQSQTEWSIDREGLLQTLEDPAVTLIDTRTPEEFAGDILFNEARGGHLPGAVLLERQELMDREGRLLPHDEILGILQEKGISPDQEIVAYCTGGIRSAWLIAVLSDLGLNAKNYPGSMWDWAAAPAMEYPLINP